MKIEEDKIPELIRQGKDREVVPLLYKKVFPLVEKTILKNSGKKEDASDVFQDALMTFYKQIMKGTFDPKYKVFGYLYRLSLNFWINKVKKESRIQLKEDIMEEAGEMNGITAEPALTVEQNVIDSLFSMIGDKCKELLTYSIINNMLLEDIMIRMEFTSVSAVKMQHQRCKQKLISELEKNPSLKAKLKGI